MTALSETVHVERRFALSARVDSDLSGTPPLAGYVLQPSASSSLSAMAQGISDARQCTFTWTGPYGGGKSCAALLVANLVSTSSPNRKIAKRIVGDKLGDEFVRAFPEDHGPWEVLAITGRRADLAADLSASAGRLFKWTEEMLARANFDDRALIDLLEEEGARRGGLLIIIDELGKFLEYAISQNGDIHLLQDLAERANRSDGRLVVVGILHQSFEQYAGKFSRSSRDEWAKVQGRFQNIPFVSQADEIAALLAKAIVKTVPSPAAARSLADRTAAAVAARRPVDPVPLAEAMWASWPLHPLTCLLLGPVSRQRFAQNERSVFGFLSSAEPFGFQAHLASTNLSDENAWFGPDRLWDYLIANFGSALTVGAEGARMTLAVEAVERAALRSALAASLTKAAALIEFFKTGTGLAVTDEILRLCAPFASEDDVDAALADLVAKAILIRQPRLGGYALFAGSDFDLDDAMRLASERLDPSALTDLPSRLGIGPVAAKHHYFTTGSLRTFDVLIQFAEDVPSNAEAWAVQTAQAIAKHKRRATGILVLLMPDAYTFEAKPAAAAKSLAVELEKAGVLAAVAMAKNVFMLRDHATDLYALDRIEASHPQLEGDRIARRELSARRAHIVDSVRRELLETLLAASWWACGERERTLDGTPLSIVASALATKAFDETPVIHSELLNRDKPSTSAMAGLRALLHAMATQSRSVDLGIEGFPAELGLYLTILKPFGLHRQDDAGVWRFQDPDESSRGKTLLPAWKVLSVAKRLTLQELFDRWAARPIGLKRGVMPVFALAFLLAHRAAIAVYVDGIYQAVIDEVFVDKMMQDPNVVELRRVTRSKKHDGFLMRLATLLSTPEEPVEAASLPVASALYQRFHALPLWTQRTATIVGSVAKVRDAVLKASDPEALLFASLSDLLKDEVEPAVAVIKALTECESAYPKMLGGLRALLAEKLGVPVDTFAGIGVRAVTATGVMADLRLDAFAMRAGAFEGSQGDIEGLASLLVHKPARTWTDREQEQAFFELVRLAQRFRQAEMFAEVKGRRPTAQAISVMVGLNPLEQPLFHSFEVTDKELDQAEKLASAILVRMRKETLRTEVELAVLARLVERLSSEDSLVTT